MRNAFDLFAEIQAEAEERILIFRSKVVVWSLRYGILADLAERFRQTDATSSLDFEGWMFFFKRGVFGRTLGYRSKAQRGTGND